jgi:hypothetical protein
LGHLPVAIKRADRLAAMTTWLPWPPKRIAVSSEITDYLWRPRSAAAGADTESVRVSETAAGSVAGLDVARQISVGGGFGD